LVTPTARAVSATSTLIGIPAPSVIPPPATSTAQSSAAPAAPPAPSEPRSDTPVALTTDEAKPGPDAKGKDDVPSAPTATEAATTDDETRTKRRFSNTRADSPQAKGERARATAPLRVSVPAPDSGTSLSRWLMVSLVIAALIMGGRWYMQSRALKTASLGDERSPAAAAPATTDTAPRATALAASAAAQPTSEVIAPPSDAPSATASAPSASAVEPNAETTPPTASAAPSDTNAPTTASAAPSASSAPAEGTRTVVVKISPPTARLFRKGKSVGSSPVTIELAPGEKRSYEVGAPGWATRRLVVDGSKPEVFIGLKPEK
jgi:hypothetical protein